MSYVLQIKDLIFKKKILNRPEWHTWTNALRTNPRRRYTAKPPPRGDTQDSATAVSGVTTLGRVAVSGGKKGRIYISF
jgi:hypothetical protein